MNLINFSGCKNGGGRSIAIGVLQNLHISKSTVVVFPDEKLASFICNKNLISVIIPKVFRSQFFALFLSEIYLPLIVKKYFIKKIINFSDLIINCPKVFQIYYFDWAFLFVSDHNLLRMFSLKDRIYKYLKKFLIVYRLKYISLFIAQTDFFEQKFKKIYSHIPTAVLPNAFNFNDLYLVPKLQEGHLYLGYLANYYPHKNHQILFSVCDLAVESNLKIKIYLTLDENNLPSYFSRKLKSSKYRNVIKNLGTIPHTELSNFYSSLDAVIFPSLLESFTGSLVEPLVLNIPILASDRFFVSSICGKKALYFDPLSEQSIFDAIQRFLQGQRLTESKGNPLDIISWREFCDKLSKISNL